MDDLKRFYGEVGRRIRAERERRGLTQEALAKGVGLTRVSVTNIEKGRQRVFLHMVRDFCDVLDVEPAALLPEAAHEKPEIDVLLRKHSRKEREFVTGVISSFEPGAKR